MDHFLSPSEEQEIVNAIIQAEKTLREKFAFTLNTDLTWMLMKEQKKYFLSWRCKRQKNATVYYFTSA
jgi:hypothetical protein